jgi:hypothetical protein
MTDWNRGFQEGWNAGERNKLELRRELQTLKDDHRAHVNNTAHALIDADKRNQELEIKLRAAYQDCADMCERRAESLREGQDVARLCKRDILSRLASI